MFLASLVLDRKRGRRDVTIESGVIWARMRFGRKDWVELVDEIDVVNCSGGVRERREMRDVRGGGADNGFEELTVER